MSAFHCTAQRPSALPSAVDAAGFRRVGLPPPVDTTSSGMTSCRQKPTMPHRKQGRLFRWFGLNGCFTQRRRFAHCVHSTQAFRSLRSLNAGVSLTAFTQRRDNASGHPRSRAGWCTRLQAQPRRSRRRSHAGQSPGRSWSSARRTGWSCLQTGFA